MLGFGTKKTIQATEFMLETPFKMGVAPDIFQDTYCIEIYKRILTDCFQKSAGIEEKVKPVFWDSCLTSEATKGLITILAEAMYKQTKVYLIFNSGVVRITNDATEKKKIDDDPSGKSGVACDFSQFAKSTLMKLFSEFLYNILHTANTGLNISKALQIGIENLRALVAQNNAEEAIAQMKAINQALKEGKGFGTDAKDVIKAANFDAAPTEKALAIFFGLMANVLGFSLTYIAGEIIGGMNTTGESEVIITERGLAYYFNSVFKPVVDKLLGQKVTMKTENWRKLIAVKDFLPVLEQSDLFTAEEKAQIKAEIWG